MVWDKLQRSLVLLHLFAQGKKKRKYKKKFHMGQSIENYHTKYKLWWDIQGFTSFQNWKTPHQTYKYKWFILLFPVVHCGTIKPRFLSSHNKNYKCCSLWWLLRTAYVCRVCNHHWSRIFPTLNPCHLCWGINTSLRNVMRYFSYCNTCCKYIFHYKTKYELHTKAHYLITQFYSPMT